MSRSNRKVSMLVTPMDHVTKVPTERLFLCPACFESFLSGGQVTWEELLPTIGSAWQTGGKYHWRCVHCAGPVLLLTDELDPARYRFLLKITQSMEVPDGV
jgi:hypothetical protein